MKYRFSLNTIVKILQILVLIFCLSVVVNAQTITDRSEKSILSGTVFDKYGAVIPQTKITFTNKDGKEFITISNEEGFYKIELNEGKYEIEFDKEGFQKLVSDNYKLAFRSKIQLDISLDIRSCDDPKMNCHLMTDDPKKIIKFIREENY